MPGRRSEGAAVEEPIQILEDALEASKQAQTYFRRDFIYAYLAAAYVKEGDYERVNALLAAGLEIAKRFGYADGYALCTEVKGCLAAKRGERKAAVELMERALRQFDDLSIVPSVARCRQQRDALLEQAKDSSAS